jgi:hypothetical protein
VKDHNLVRLLVLTTGAVLLTASMQVVAIFLPPEIFFRFSLKDYNIALLLWAITSNIYSKIL